MKRRPSAKGKDRRPAEGGTRPSVNEFRGPATAASQPGFADKGSLPHIGVPLEDMPQDDLEGGYHERMPPQRRLLGANQTWPRRLSRTGRNGFQKPAVTHAL